MNERTDRLRRRLVAAGAITGFAGLGGWTRSALAQAASVELPILNGRRQLVAFPEKRPLIVLTSRPPQLETPFEVFDEGPITPNDAFFVRYHNAAIPTSIDADKHVIRIGGNAAGKPFELMLYPKSRHGVTDPLQARHLRQVMLEFIVRTLKPGTPGSGAETR